MIIVTANLIVESDEKDQGHLKFQGHNFICQCEDAFHQNWCSSPRLLHEYGQNALQNTTRQVTVTYVCPTPIQR